MNAQVQRRSRTAAAPDFRTQEPRSPSAELEGYPWLPRMLDKARATRRGQREPVQHRGAVAGGRVSCALDG